MGQDRIIHYMDFEQPEQHGFMLPPGWDRVTNEHDIYTATGFARDLIDQSPILGSSSIRRMGLNADTLDQAVSLVGTEVNARYPFYERDADAVNNGSLGEMLQRLRYGQADFDCRVTTIIALEVLKELYGENIALKLANAVPPGYRNMSSAFPLLSIHPLIMYNPPGVDFSSATILNFKIPEDSPVSEMKLVYSGQYQRLINMGELFEFDATPTGIIEQETAFLNGYRADTFG